MVALIPDAPADALGEALHLLRMRGAFYSHTEATAPWALEMPAIADSVTFHVVTSGECWLEVAGTEGRSLRSGDLALVPHGEGHHLVSAPGVRPAGRVDQLPQTYYGDHYSVLHYGGGGDPTRLLCGMIAFDEPSARALMQALPAVVHIDTARDPGSSWIHETVRLLAAELTDLRPGGETVTTRLADILVVQAIRTWLEQDTAARNGWLGALRDERIGKALAAVHRRPGDDWTLDRLAREATMSRSAFAARFTELVDQPPMAYVTRWRMQVAYSRLQDGRTSVGELAHGLGYRSQAAFTRAYTRVMGHTPRAARRGEASAGPQPGLVPRP